MAGSVSCQASINGRQHGDQRQGKAVVMHQGAVAGGGRQQIDQHQGQGDQQGRQ